MSREAAPPSAQHWDRVYAQRNPTSLSWYQAVPKVSLELVELLAAPTHSAVVDAGGTSALVGALLERGFDDLTIVDVSESALDASRNRLGVDSRVTWVHADLLTWQPERQFDLWHDRAVFHFLATPVERDRYMRLLSEVTRPGAAVIIGTFAPTAPDYCSGLPVSRFSVEELGPCLGDAFELVATQNETHITPNGAVQPFSWVAARRRD